MADIIITIRIPEDKKEEFRESFLKISPVPLQNVAGPGEIPDMQPIMTEKQWLTFLVKEYLKEKYRQGKFLLAKESAQIDEDVISE